MRHLQLGIGWGVAELGVERPGSRARGAGSASTAPIEQRVVLMTKDEFAALLADKADLSKGKAKQVIKAIFGTDPKAGIIASELDAGRSFTVTGFGSFGTRVRKSREGRNPRTGEPIQVPDITVPTFRPGLGLRQRVRD